ncbi:LOW QUALITY PROTEIN: tudor domain-containing protein 10 [Dugong dugon]
MLTPESDRSWRSSDFQPSAKWFGKNGALVQQKSPGFKKRDTEVYAGSLPPDVCEAEILNFLKDFSPLRVHKIQNGCKGFASVELGSVQKVVLAVQELNGMLFHKRNYMNSNKKLPRRNPGLADSPLELPALEKVSGEVSAQSPAGTQASTKRETERPKTTFFPVPMEMRGSFLVLLLRDCFPDLSWLATVPHLRGEVGLLVTAVIPQTPFFWAMHVTENLQQDMEVPFSTLAETEEQQPYLNGSAMQHRTGCVTEYLLVYGWAWNRCWVIDQVDAWAVEMFVHFGSATIPLQSLRSFWAIPPLTQPFMLEKDILSSYQVIRHILKGKITGAVNLEVTTSVSIGWPLSPAMLESQLEVTAQAWGPGLYLPFPETAQDEVIRAAGRLRNCCVPRLLIRLPSVGSGPGPPRLGYRRTPEVQVSTHRLSGEATSASGQAYDGGGAGGTCSPLKPGPHVYTSTYRQHSADGSQSRRPTSPLTSPEPGVRTQVYRTAPPRTKANTFW